MSTRINYSGLGTRLQFRKVILCLHLARFVGVGMTEDFVSLGYKIDSLKKKAALIDLIRGK